MKKSLSLLLSVLLIISSFIGVFTVTTAQAETAATEFVTNGDFEDTSLNAVGSNMPSIMGSQVATSLLNGKWYRITGGNSYSTYGDLIAYDEENDKITKAAATDYAKYFAPCSTVVAQPDDQSNHIGRSNQTLLQAINFNEEEGTFVFKAKARGNELTTYFTLTLAGLQTKNSTQFVDYTYTKYSLEVIDFEGNFTCTVSNNQVKITPNNSTEWTDIELVVKATKIADPQPTKAEFSIVDTDYTMLYLGHASSSLSDKDQGKLYRKNGMYFDDISLKNYANPFGQAEFYKNGQKLANTNEYASVKITKDGVATAFASVGDTVTATPVYNEDANIFAGWYKNGELVTNNEALTFTVNSTDVYVPKFVNVNLLESTAASYENFANNTSLKYAGTDYPSGSYFGGNKNAGYLGATFDETIYDNAGNAIQQTAGGTVSANAVSVTVSTNKAHSGTKSISLKNSWWTASLGLDVKPNTNYTFSYWILAPKQVDLVNTIALSAIATTVNTGQSGTGSKLPLNQAKNLYLDSKDLTPVHDGQNWVKVTHTFNSKNLSKVYWVVSQTSYNATGNTASWAYIDDISLVADKKVETVDVKYVDANGNALADNIVANLAVEATVSEDLLTAEKTANVICEAGPYTFLGWYNANDELVSQSKSFVTTGSLEGVYAKVQYNNLLINAASYEGFANGTSLIASDMNRNPNEGEWGESTTAGYFQATLEEVIYDKYGYAYQQVTNGTRKKYGAAVKITTDKAHTGTKSVVAAGSWATTVTALNVEPNTDYVVSFYVLTSDESILMKHSAIATTVNVASIIPDTDPKQSAIPPVALDGGTLSNGFVTALGNMGDAYSLSKVSSIQLSSSEWTKITHKFNSGNLTKVYFCVCPSGGEKYYIDDMTMIKTTSTTLDLDMKSCASVELVGTTMDAIYVNQELTFKVIDNMDTAAKVTFNGQTVAANDDGTYTVVLGETNALSVRFDGDENLPNYDEDEFGRKLNVNNLDVYTEPVWEGDTVYHETALFTPDKDTVKLLYPVDEIVSLRSYDLKTNYIEGYDFEITEDGMIKRLEGGRIPVWATSLVSDTDTDWDRTDGKYVVLTGDQTYPKFAISVTYKHSTTFADGYQPAAPESQYNNLNNVITKLEKGEEVNIVIYGDSISCGWSSSGMNYDIKIYDETNTEGNYITRYNINVAPYAPTWIQMLEAKLNEMYPDATINFKNLSLGGKSSPWGAENIEARLALWKDANGNQVVPDLMLVGFGVNDSAGGVTVENFKKNMAAIVDNARVATGNYAMEVLMYSPMFPNQDAVKWPAATLLAYENAMVEIAAEDSNVGVLKLSSIFSEIVKCKDPEDYLNTNLNHGNDFTARLYLTGILAAMEKAENVVELPTSTETFADAGVSIRRENEVKGKPQALRFKLVLSRNVLAANFEGYTLVEYGGIIAAAGNYGTSLELNDVTAGKAIKGVAYSAAEGTETLFDQTETSNIFTMALYNIGAIKDASGNITGTDYTKWGKGYSVRGYAIYKAEGKEDIIVYADDTVTASVFAVFEAILKGDNEDDITYVNELLENLEIAEAWENFNK